MTPMEAQAQAKARELVAKINGQRSRIAGGYDIPRDEPGPVALISAALTDAYAQGRRDEQDAIVKRVELLVGKDSGNWNRAITYAMDAIRAQAVQDGPHKLDQLRKWRG